MKIIVEEIRFESNKPNKKCENPPNHIRFVTVALPGAHELKCANYAAKKSLNHTPSSTGEDVQHASKKLGL